MYSRGLRMKDSLKTILKRIDFSVHSILETVKNQRVIANEAVTSVVY